MKPKHPLKQFRETHKLTQTELGILIDVTPVVLAQVEGGYRRMISDILDKFCNRFNISSEEYLEQEKEYRKQYKEFLIEEKLN